MKIHAEFNNLAEVAAFARFAESGLSAAPEKTEKQLAKEKEKEESWRWKYERTVANLERALYRISLLDPKGKTANYDAYEAPTAEPIDSVDLLELSVRATNVLKAEGIKTLEQLCSKTRRDLMKVPNCGRITIEEIQEALAKRKLRLKERR